MIESTSPDCRVCWCGVARCSRSEPAGSEAGRLGRRRVGAGWIGVGGRGLGRLRRSRAVGRRTVVVAAAGGRDQQQGRQCRSGSFVERFMSPFRVVESSRGSVVEPRSWSGVNARGSRFNRMSFEISGRESDCCDQISAAARCRPWYGCGQPGQRGGVSHGVEDVRIDEQPAQRQDRRCTTDLSGDAGRGLSGRRPVPVLHRLVVRQDRQRGEFRVVARNSPSAIPWRTIASTSTSNCSRSAQ